MKQRNFLKYLLVFVVFAGAFTFFFFSKKAGLEKEFLAACAKVPSIRDFNSALPAKAMTIVNSYGKFAGAGLGLLAFLISLIFLGILKIVRLAKFSLANMLILFLIYGGYLALAIELIHFEVRYTVLAIAIIFFAGYPLYSAAITTLIFIFIIYLLTMIFGRKKSSFARATEDKSSSVKATEDKSSTDKVEEKKSVAAEKIIAAGVVAVALSFTLSGCSLIGWLEGDTCDINTDPHCNQGAAVDQGDDSDCAKVKQPADLKSVGSNPPKDKCYLMVAENTDNFDACDKIQGGMYSYTREECILDTATANEDPIGCQKLSGSDKADCVEQLGPKITVEKVLEVDSQIDILNEELKKGSDANLEKQLKGLQDKKNAMLAVMTADNKKEYNIEKDPVNKEVIGDWATGEIDAATKNKIININEALKAAGEGLTKEQYATMRDYYKFVNDPANNIENMDDKTLAKDTLGDKFHNVVDKLKFWKVNDTADEKALDEQIRFYTRMSDRQAGIDKGLDVKETAYENLVDKIKEKAVEKGVEKGAEMAVEESLGEAAGKTFGVTTKVLGEAIDEVKEEAKSAEFRGMVNAYDQGMAEELSKVGGNIDKANDAVVKKLMADPYAYATGDSFAKYGNLIENKDCDGSNPHCLNKAVFWKAMKKSYKYQHQS